MTDHPAPLSHRESAATPTDTKNEAQAAQRPLQRESGHILDETQVRIIRKNAEVVRRSPERAASYTDLVLYQLDSLADSHEALRASHAALTARLAAVERERAAQDGRWRALVGAQSPYMQHQSACEYWHGDTGCDCGLCRLQAQAQAALAGEA